MWEAWAKLRHWRNQLLVTRRPDVDNRQQKSCGGSLALHFCCSSDAQGCVAEAGSARPCKDLLSVLVCLPSSCVCVCLSFFLSALPLFLITVCEELVCVCAYVACVCACVCVCVCSCMREYVCVCVCA
jgi:hypothetical protein